MKTLGFVLFLSKEITIKIYFSSSQTCLHPLPVLQHPDPSPQWVSLAPAGVPQPHFFLFVLHIHQNTLCRDCFPGPAGSVCFSAPPWRRAVVPLRSANSAAPHCSLTPSPEVPACCPPWELWPWPLAGAFPQQICFFLVLFLWPEARPASPPGALCSIPLVAAERTQLPSAFHLLQPQIFPPVTFAHPPKCPPGSLGAQHNPVGCSGL